MVPRARISALVFRAALVTAALAAWLAFTLDVAAEVRTPPGDAYFVYQVILAVITALLVFEGLELARGTSSKRSAFLDRIDRSAADDGRDDAANDYVPAIPDGRSRLGPPAKAKAQDEPPPGTTKAPVSRRLPSPRLLIVMAVLATFLLSAEFSGSSNGGHVYAGLAKLPDSAWWPLGVMLAFMAVLFLVEMIAIPLRQRSGGVLGRMETFGAGRPTDPAPPLTEERGRRPRRQRWKAVRHVMKKSTRHLGTPTIYRPRSR